MTARKQDPEFTPRQLAFTGGNVMVSGSILVLAITLTVSAVMLKNSFENRMNSIEWRLDAMNRERWTLPMQREYNNALRWENEVSKLKVPDVDAIKTRIP
jgi:hypothetical protein